MHRVIIISLLAVMSSNALSNSTTGNSPKAEWGRLGSTDEYIAYANPATIHRTGDMATMRILLDDKTPQKFTGGTYMSTVRQDEYDCKQVQSRTLTFTGHSENMAGGNVVFDGGSNPSKWSAIPPSSVRESLWQFACGKRQ